MRPKKLLFRLQNKMNHFGIFLKTDLSFLNSFNRLLKESNHSTIETQSKWAEINSIAKAYLEYIIINIVRK